MKATFLIWNIGKADGSKRLKIKEALNSWIKHEGINIIALIECKKEKAEDIKNSLIGNWELLNQDQSGEVRLLTKLSKETINLHTLSNDRKKLEYESQISAALEHIDMHNFADNYKESIKKEIKERLVWFSVSQENKVVAVCALVHFYSKILQDQERNSAFIKVIKGISNKFFEDHLYKIMLLGDFNLNPYDTQMYHNATKSGHLLTLPNRRAILENEDYSHYFYNPMWLLVGDNSVIINGDIKRRTNYTYLTTKYKNKFSTLHQMKENEKNFNLIDGVLLAKDLIPAFQNKIRILDWYICEHGRLIYLINNDLTLKKDLYSDHLPIIFELEF